MRSRTGGKRSTAYPGANLQNVDRRFDFVEDFGEDCDNLDVKKRNRQHLFSGPMMFLWSCSRTVFSPAVFCALAMISSLVSIQFVDGVLVTVASAFSMVVALLVLLQQRKLRRLGNLRRQHIELRRRANYFHQERERLHRTQERLDQLMADLHYVPQELHKLSKNQDVSILMEIVAEQRIVQDAIRHKIQQKVMQKLLDIVMKADKDNNYALGPKEIELLIIRLGLVKGVEFNEARFRQMLAEDASIHSIFAMLRSMRDREDEYQYSDSVFTIKSPETAQEVQVTDKLGGN